MDRDRTLPSPSSSHTYIPPSSLQRAAALLTAASSGDETGLKALLDEEAVHIIDRKDQVGA